MFSLCYYTAGLLAWGCETFRPRVTMQLIFTSHFSSCNSLIDLLGILASELGLVDRHPLKGHVLHCTRPQFHGCLDSACTVTWVIGFPKAYRYVSASVSFLPNEWSRHRKVACMFFSQSFALVCFESVIQKYVLLNKNVWLLRLPSFSITGFSELLLCYHFFFNCQSFHSLFVYNLKLQFSWIFPEVSWRSLKVCKIPIPEVFYSVCLSASFSGYGSKFSELQNPFLCDSWYQCFWHLFFIQCMCHLFWHGAKQFTASLNGLSVVFHLNFFTFFFVFVFFGGCVGFLFVCFFCLLVWFFACVFEESLLPIS